MPVTPIPYYQIIVTQRGYGGQAYGGSLLFSFTSAPEGVEAVSLSHVWDEMRHRIEKLQDEMDGHMVCDLTRTWVCVPPDVDANRLVFEEES